MDKIQYKPERKEHSYSDSNHPGTANREGCTTGANTRIMPKFDFT
jgi:hypothetical protein